MSNCFDRIVVSTDDPEIAAVALNAGAEVPFIRPKELSNDVAGTVSVIGHAVSTLGLLESELVCCLYATAPFVKAHDLHRAIDLFLRSSEPDYAVSVTTYAFPIQRALRLSEDGLLELEYPEHEATRSQDLAETWHDAGQFYFARATTWQGMKPVFSSRAVPVAIPRWRVQDIDTREDWEQAERMFRAEFGESE